MQQLFFVLLFTSLAVFLAIENSSTLIGTGDVTFYFTANEDGSALIEVAFALPVLILILAGTIDFGLFTERKMPCVEAANAAAAYGALSGKSTQHVGHDQCGAGSVRCTQRRALCKRSQQHQHYTRDNASVQGYVTPWVWIGTEVRTPSVAVSWPRKQRE